MLSAHQCYQIFQKSIHDYHVHDDVDAPMRNPLPAGTFESLLYMKSWIDSVQWHLEDIIRNPAIDPSVALGIKRRIDASNQLRTDTVEKIDDAFLLFFRDIKTSDGARINSETPAWLLDRMSILMLKIYHMREQTERTDVNHEHIVRCRGKLSVLEEQQRDMAAAYDELLEDIAKGVRRFKVYRQMKMYNDATLNPMLYKTQS